MLLSDLVASSNDQLSIEVTLNDAIERMEHEGLSQIIFVKDKIAVGMLTLKNIIELYASGISRENMAIDFITHTIISIHNDRPIDMAVEMMIDYEIRRIVLIDENGYYIATLNQSDVLRYYENNIYTTDEIFQCLHKRNRAIFIECNATVKAAVQLMRDEHRDALVVMRENDAIGIVTENDIVELVYQKTSSDAPISSCIGAPIVTVGMDGKIHHAIETMKESNIHHLMVRGNDEIYLLNEKDLVLSYNTTLEVKLEGKLRDAKATYNLLGIAFCEIIDLGDIQIIKWLNAEAMLTFHVNIDDPVSAMVGLENWNRLMEEFRIYKGVERQRVEVRGCIYELTLMETEVNNSPYAQKPKFIL